MKTYTKTIEAPRLEIRHDDTAQSPRDNDANVGYFITVEKRRNSPDDNESIISMVQNLAEESNSTKEHMEKITAEFPQNFKEKVIAIFPVSRYEHSGVHYSLGMAHGFDNSNCGFYIVTDKTLAESGVNEKDIADAIQAELNLYNAWINGECYMYELFDEDGYSNSYVGSFTSLDDIKKDLPKEWQGEDMQDYLIN